MAENDKQDNRAEELAQQILDPLRSATSVGSDWTMVDGSPSDRARHGRAYAEGDDAQGDMRNQKYDFFFYGTLVVPAILVRVLGRDCSDLVFQDALLPNYTRHQVKNVDYPAVINRDQSSALIPKNELLFSEDYTTRGTLVRGLTYNDVNALDIFEGTEYSRVKIEVQTLSPPSNVHSLPRSLTDPMSREHMNKEQADKAAKNLQAGSLKEGEKPEDGPGKVPAWVYVWSEDLSGLKPEIWSFEEFMKEKAHLWVGKSTTEFDEVERHRALATLPGTPHGHPAKSPDEIGLDGDESKIIGKTAEGVPDFGHNMLQYFRFNKGYINLNHGSYGSPPVPVYEAMRKMADEIDGNPDVFQRRDYLPKLNDVCAKTAAIIGAQESEVVVVPNATHGVNNVLTEIEYNAGDIIVTFSTTYGAVSQTIKHLCDRNPALTLEEIEITFPCAHAEIVRKFEEVVSKYNEPAKPSYTGEPKPMGTDQNKRVRLAVIDTIASNPGVLLPWESLVKVCRRYGVLSLVDGAHSIGQHKVDVAMAGCDFFISNCHKWLMSRRGSAILYVPQRNQHMIRSTYPTGAGYESARYPTPGIDRPWSFKRQYEGAGTSDWAPFLTIADAIKFRQDIGGEERIMAYNHTLAVQGGRRLRKIWGTDILENPNLDDGELTCAMVNVALPDMPRPKDVAEQYQQIKYIQDKMFENNVFVAIFWHGGRLCARFSAQVWVELSDFDHIAGVLSKICEGVNRKEYVEVKQDPAEAPHSAEDLPTRDA